MTMSDDPLENVLNSMPSSAAGPSRKPKKEVTMAEFERVLDTTPLFMRETPKGGEGEENEVLEALRSLVFEGEGDEIAMNFKNHGNELHAQRTYHDAIQAYTSGLEAGPTDPDIRVSLLNNRAACNLALKNHRAVLRDTGVIIALSSTEGKEPPLKAMYRAAQSLVALERWDEARDVVYRGRQCKGEDQAWVVLGDQVEKGQRREVEKIERERRETLRKQALWRAVQSRGLVVIDTLTPPDNPHPLSFDLSSLPPSTPVFTQPLPGPSSDERWIPPPAHTPLIFPVFLLYPSHSQSDLIIHFHESTSFDDQLASIFPASPTSSEPPWAGWDEKREYFISNLAVYVETAQRRLLKVGKELTLREVIAKAAIEAKDGQEKDGVVLRDGLMSFVVLVKEKEEKEWISEFKRKRDGT